MNSNVFEIKPIGVIRTPYKDKSKAPHQGCFSKDICEIEVFREYEEGLKDIEACTHLIILYWLDRAKRDALIAIPPHDGKKHGVFATRSPNRPNPIAFAVVELVERDANVLRVRGIDALNKTPLIDIKPYSSEIDAVSNARIGWFEEAKRSRCHVQLR
ncbi:tRNA (N6-threonylcarbamoyladenosine(37)-N6)-methyltransferase TrmO [Archaeoglobales archaeon]|nr:MAG: tRNA (N6-threonylcarbamoyladenosine(37)-N6)-methyltransferase TrmO [Archaeoglobales archaeon]